MKYVRRISVCLALAAGALWNSSCSGILDQAPDGKETLDEIFLDNDKVAAYLNSCYNGMSSHGMMYWFFSRGPVVWCDEAWDADDTQPHDNGSTWYYNGRASASEFPAWSISDQYYNNYGYWDRYFTGIHDCAYFLQRIPTATVNNENDRERWTAEARLLRAYYYASLLRWFGCGLPLIDTPYGLETDYSGVKRASYYEVVKFIVADCDAALNCQYLPWRITSNDESGRLPKALAGAIKSRMIVYAASPLYNDGESHWEEAYQMNKEVLRDLRANGYALYNGMKEPATYFGENSCMPNGKAAMLNEYFCNNQEYSPTPFDKETIFQTRWGQQHPWRLDGIGAMSGYKSGTCPSQELVDCYETVDGEPILDLARPYLDEETHLQPNYNPANTLYDPDDPYKNRDTRFYAHIYYNGSERKCWWNFDERYDCYENYDKDNPAKTGYRTRKVMTYIGEPYTGLSATERSMTRTGYYIRKFIHPNSGDNLQLTTANFKEYRLAEVILNFAEAAANAGHLEEAIAAVNEIRSRVGMPGLPATLAGEPLLRRIYNERQVELAMEEFRYFDVRRLHQPDEDLATTDKYVTAMAITRNDDGTYTYNRQLVRSAQRQCYTNRWLKCPIPLDEVNRVIAITGENWQNPGW